MNDRKTVTQMLVEAKAEIQRLKSQIAHLTKGQTEAKIGATTTVKPAQSRYQMLWAEYQKISNIYERTRFFQEHQAEMEQE